ncbi:trehalase family glycosidase, partial [Bacteroidota bacterium]
MLQQFFRTIAIIVFVPIVLSLFPHCNTQERDMYFTPFERGLQKLPAFDETRPNLPDPVYDENQSFIDCYWKAWEIAFNNFYEPPPGSGFVSNYVDAAFTHSNDIFFWDTGFMTMFCNYAHPYVPGIQSMDNFYIKQHPDGEICRQINRETGVDYEEWTNSEDKNLFSRWGPLYRGGITWDVKYKGRDVPAPKPVLTLDALNHPIAAWVELESYRMTGDVERLVGIWDSLVKYYEVFQRYLRQGNGLYITDWASMDNSPRNDFLVDGGCGIDISAEMVLFAKCMSTIADIIGRPMEVEKYSNDAEELTKLINDQMWSKQDGFYYDLTIDDEKIPIKTVAAFWTLLAEVASNSQAEYLFDELK